MHIRQKRYWSLGVAAVALMVTASACSGSSGGSSGTSGSGSGIILTVAGEAVGMTRVFNPYLPTSALGLAGNSVASGNAAGFINEPLVQVDYVRSNYVIPWLAKSWAWTNGNKTLTFHLQHGVKWSDGKPFTSADVVFTYNLMKKVPALNGNGIEFSTVSAPDASTVVLTFDSAQAQNFDAIASLIIVPQHIWSTVKDPATWADPDPVGTGPFKLASFSPQGYLLTKNPGYWQPGKPQIGGLRFVAYSDNTTQATAITTGQIDWARTTSPNAATTYLNRSKDNNYWVPEAGSDGLIPNLDTYPLSDLAVRKAISLGIDRQADRGGPELPGRGEPATGLPVPSLQLDHRAAVRRRRTTSRTWPGRRRSSPPTAGHPGAGRLPGQGRQAAELLGVSFPAAYTDIAAAASVLVPQLKTLGIKMTIDTVPINEINTMTGLGRVPVHDGLPGEPTCRPPGRSTPSR